MELQNLQFANLSDHEISKLKETEQVMNSDSQKRTNEKGEEIILLAFVDKGRH